MSSAPHRSAYRRTLLDRVGADVASAMRAGIWAVTIGILVAAGGVLLALQEGTGARGVLVALIAGIAAATIVPVLSLGLTSAVGTAMRTVLVGGGGCALDPQYSYQESLLARGDVAGAIASFEALVAEHLLDVRVRLRTADVYARSVGGTAGATRAAALYGEILSHPSTTAGQEVTAANRLADLYLGPLAEPGRALRELRRIADRYAGTQAGDGARAAIATLKRERPVV